MLQIRCLLKFLCLFLLFTAVLPATTLFVGPPPASIQAVVDTAVDGDVVQLSAGTYVQEVQIVSKSIDLVGLGQGVSIIQAPGPDTHLTQNFSFGGITWWCIVMVDNQAAPTPQTVNIRDLTVDGDSQQDTVTPPYGSTDRFFAIGYHNANGTVQDVHTTNTRQSTNFDELAGGGIVNASDTGAVSFTVTDCLIDFYQRIGIDCRGPSLTADINNNTVDRGYLLTPNTITATPSGIQFFGFVTGSITNNSVMQNVGTAPGTAGLGIIAFQAGSDVNIANNVCTNNDIGIACVNNGNNLIIDSNTINYTLPVIPSPPNDIEGILVQQTIGLTTLSSNIMNDIPSVNMDLFSPTDQNFALSDNQFFGSSIGLLVTGSGAAGPVVTMDSDAFVGTRDFYVYEVTAPNDIWPSTATVSFDGLISGHMTFAQFNQILTKIHDKHNDPALGLVLAFIPPIAPLPPTNFVGLIKRNKFLLESGLFLKATWGPSSSFDVVLYRIYNGSRVVAEIPATDPLVFKQATCSLRTVRGYEIVAVSFAGIESSRVPIQIVRD